MVSEGVSVWFACKLCPSFFLNADDFAYHKKKSHVQEFRSTKFIVFEEQTTPPASPPENWVSFLSPKEERHIHKIISSPSSPPPKTNLDCDYNHRNENTQSNRNKEFAEIDLETHKVSIFNNHDDRGDTAADVTNNCVGLNSALKSYSDVDILQNQLLQSRAEPPIAGCDLTGKGRDKQCSVIKSNSLKISEQNKKHQPISSSSNVLQTVIQSPHNPYVYLKRLKLITIQNPSSPPSNSDVAVHSQENVRSHVNAHNRTQHSTFSFTATPETTKGHPTELVEEGVKVAPKNASFCNNSTDETNLLLSIIHSDHHVYRTVFNPKLELDPVFNADADSNSNLVSNPTTEVNLNYGELLEVAKSENVVDANEDSAFPGVNHDSFELESRDNALGEEMLIFADADNLNESQAPQMGFNCASCKIHFIHVREIREHNKNHHVTPDGKRRFACPYPGCETVSSSQYHIKGHLQCVHSNERPFKCPHPDCNMSFKTLRNKMGHLRVHTADASRSEFECPYTNCGKTTTSKFNLRRHIQQVHSNVRPLKCHHPNCTESFNVVSRLNAHLKRHAKYHVN